MFPILHTDRLTEPSVITDSTEREYFEQLIRELRRNFETSDINFSRVFDDFYIESSIRLKIQRNTVSTIIDTTAYQWNGNTDSASFVYTLPVGVQDTQYKVVNTGTAGNSLTLTPNGLEKLLGINSSFILYDGESLLLGYDKTDGWY